MNQPQTIQSLTPSKPPKTALTIILAISLIPVIIGIIVLILFLLPGSFLSSPQSAYLLLLPIFAFAVPFAIIARAIEKHRLYQLSLEPTPPPNNQPNATPPNSDKSNEHTDIIK